MTFNIENTEGDYNNPSENMFGKMIRRTRVNNELERYFLSM